MAEKKVIDLRVNSNLDKVTKDAAGLKNQVEKTSSSFGGLGDALTTLNPAFGTAIQGAQALNASFVALLSNPVVPVIAGIVAVVTLLYKAFNTTEENGNKLGKGMTVLSGLFSGLLKILEPIASFLVENLVKGFELAGQAVFKLSGIIERGLRVLGFEAAAVGLNVLTNAVEKNIKQSQRLADAEAKLVEAQRLSQKVQLDFQKQAEKIRQQRDDETNSVATRIKLNAQLGALLQKQLNEELKIANQALTVANLRIQIEGKSKANLDERAEALTTISDIQERISGQESEQLANLNSLRRESDALDKESKEKKALATQKEVDDYIAAEQKKLSIEKQINADIARIDAEFTTADNAIKEQQRQDEVNDKVRQGKLLADINKANNDKQLADDKAAAEAKLAIQTAAIQSAGQIGNLLQQLAGKNKAIAKAGIVIESAASIASIVMNVNKGIFKEVGSKGFVGLATAAPIIIGGIASVASTIAAAKKGLQALGGGGGVGGAPSIGGLNGGARPQDTAPQFNVVGSNGISQVAQSLSQNRQPIKAFVVGKDVSTQQALDRNIVKFASLG